MSALLDRVLGDGAGLNERLERERSRMTHEVFLMAESGVLPDEAERRSRARAATARGWMTHIAANLGPEIDGAPPDLGAAVETWFSANGERREVLELDLARRVAAGPIDDYETRARRVDLGAAARWLFEAVGAVADPDGDGGPPFARRASAWMDAHDGRIADMAAAERLADPDDPRVAETAELIAHVRATVEALEATLPGPSAGPAPSA